MSISDEDKKGYIAIGEAVISRIFDKEEVSRESLILKLDQQAEQETDEDQLADIAQGRKILQGLDVTDGSPGGNVVDLNTSRHAVEYASSEEDEHAEGDDDDRDKAKNG